MIRVQDHKARQNPGQNKSDTQQWAEMVNQSRARWAYVNHHLNRSVGVKAWELPRLEYSTTVTWWNWRWDLPRKTRLSL